MSDRLHHEDGSPRSTARSANGRELTWFERNGPCHHEPDPVNWSFDVTTALHDDMKGGGTYRTVRSRVTVSRQEFPTWPKAAEVAACMAVAIHGGMPTEILARY